MLGIRAAYKKIKKFCLDRKVHPVRRIDSVAPPPGKRVVAITFDDGPCAGPARPFQEQVTAMILDTLRQFGARGTFDVIGTTALKYPDEPGKAGGPYWNGVYFDHYPSFGEDSLAGVVNQRDLAKQIVDRGHELSNHGFTHMAFGPCRYPYARRRYLRGFQAVLADLTALHDTVRDVTGFSMRLARPPHYIDRIQGGSDAYDAYRVMDYLYLGAGFDGGGWKPSTGDFGRDVEDMVAPLRSALERDPDALNGSIIFHKDGYNMSGEAPAPFGLRLQLEVLKRYDYQVVTVSELLRLSEFSDMGPGHPCYPAASAMSRAGFSVAFAGNCVKPDGPVTLKDLAVLCIPRTGFPAGWETMPHLVLTEGGSTGAVVSGRLRPDQVSRACIRFLRLTPIAEEERVRRTSLVLQLKDSAAAGPITRGRAISFLSATFLGI